MNNTKIQTTSMLRSKNMPLSTCSRTLQMALNASKSTKFGFTIRNQPLYMCIVSVFLELRINFFIDEGQEVPGDKVLPPPGDDTLAPKNPKIQILLKKLAYKHVHCPW